MADYPASKERRVTKGHHNPERRKALQTVPGQRIVPDPLPISNEWKQYESVDEYIEARPWDDSFPMGDVEVLDVDKANGSPMLGDMIARRIDEPNEVWIISEAYFLANYEHHNPNDSIPVGGPLKGRPVDESWRLNETWKEHRLRKRLAWKP